MIDNFTGKIHTAQENRLELLSSAINFKNELECDDLASEMTQKIYFKGFEYTFNDEGFVDKCEITDERLKQRSEGIMIKEKTNQDGLLSSEDITIPTAVDCDLLEGDSQDGNKANDGGNDDNPLN